MQGEEPVTNINWEAYYLLTLLISINTRFILVF